MRTNKEYKNAALAALKGNWAPALLASVIFIGIVWAVILPYYTVELAAYGLIKMEPLLMLLLLCFSWLGMLLLVRPIGVGFSNAFLQFMESGESDLTQKTFKGAFKGYWRNVWGIFLAGFFIFLWSLLLLIPGIIKGYSYALVPYLLKEHPELSANQCINLSCKMMEGRKFDLFWLQLSFIGWVILASLTLGIGLLWLVPYAEASFAAFYQDVKREY